MKRREFLCVSAIGLGVIFLGCGKVLTPEDESYDITLIGDLGADATELARFFEKSDPYGKLTAGEKIRIKMVDNGKETPAAIFLTSDKHPALVHGKENEARSGELVFSGLSLKLIDSGGNVIKGEDGKDVSAGLFSPKDFSSFLKYGLESGIIKTEDILRIWKLAGEYKKLKEKAKDALAPALLEMAESLKNTRGELLDKVFSLGVKVTAVALAVWLGSSIASAILSGIAFVAFYALLIGALAIILGKTETILAWIFKLTGVEITIQDMTDFFGKSAEYIGDLLANITGSLKTSFAR